jgi:type VI secretion system protein ImpI
VLTGLRLSIRDEATGEVRAHAFARLPVRIGRNPLNDLQLTEPFISQFHAVIEVDPNGQLALRDLGSRNGTMIAGQRVPPNERLGLGGSEASFSVLGLTFEARLASVAEDRVPKALRTSGARSARVMAETLMGDANGPMQVLARPPIAATIEAQVRATRAAIDALNDLLAQELPKLHQPQRDIIVSEIRGACPEALESPKARGLLGSLGIFEVASGRAVVEALRAFAAAYSTPETAPVSDDDLRRFVERLQTVVDVFFKTFIPLRDGHRKFESGLNIQNFRLTGRPQAAVQVHVGNAQTPQALGQVLFDPRDERASAARQVEETFADLMIHQVALLGGVMRGVTALLKELSPVEIERALDQKTYRGDVGASWGWLRWRALYRIFVTRHADYADEEKKTFSKVFGGEFAEAYGRFLESGETDKA